MDNIEQEKRKFEVLDALSRHFEHKLEKKRERAIKEFYNIIFNQIFRGKK